VTPERWKRVGELFEAAVEQEPAARAEFLARAASGDGALAEEVLRLLASDENAGAFLNSPAGLGSAPVGDDHLAPRLELLREENPSLAVDLKTLLREDHALGDEGLVKTEINPRLVEPGARVGNYQLLREIGHGGMGVVYLAVRADDSFQKRVAIKLVKRGMDGDAIVQRFRRERQILAVLEHPHIARLLDGGSTDEGLPYFVMEYIEGWPLLSYCDEQKLSIRRRLELFLEVCSAVQYAHDNSVIHRDLKPSNLLVTSKGSVKLLDFGIAKLLHAELLGHPADATATAVRAMTPEYASPEQILGKPITPASDIYSLGVVLYELLSGIRPYAEQCDIKSRVASQVKPLKPSSAVLQAEKMVVHDKPAQMGRTVDQIGSTRATTPLQLRRHLSGDLDTIVLRAMHIDPARRYGSAHELSEDVQRYLRGFPIVARKDGVLYRTAKFFRRHRAAVLVNALVFAAALLAAGGVALKLRQAAPSGAIRSLAVLPLKNLSSDPEQEYFSEGLTDELIARLASLDGLRVISHTSVMQYKEARKPLPVIAKELNVDMVMEGSVLRLGERVRVTAQIIDAADDRHFWAETYERDHRDILALQNEVTREIARSIKLKLNPSDRQRLAVSRQVNPEAHADYLRGRFYLSKRTVSELETAARYFEQAIALDASYASAYAGLADSYALLAGYDSATSPGEVTSKARAAAAKALEIDETLAEAHTSLALIAQNYDWDWETAEREYRRSIELDPNYATAHHWYAEFLSYLGRFDEAFSQIELARQLDPRSLIIAADKGAILYYSRQHELAIQQFRSVLEVGPKFPRAYIVRHPLVEMGRFAEALALTEGIIAMYGESMWDLAWLTYIYSRGGQYQLARNALARLEERKGRKDLGVDPRPMVMAYVSAGKMTEAFAWLDRCYRERCTMLTNLKVDPLFDPLRGDPRFMELLRRVGFEK